MFTPHNKINLLNAQEEIHVYAAAKSAKELKGEEYRNIEREGISFNKYILSQSHHLSDWCKLVEPITVKHEGSSSTNEESASSGNHVVFWMVHSVMMHRAPNLLQEMNVYLNRSSVQN